MKDHTTLDATTPHPRKLGTRETHYWLAQRMAKRTGADLCTAFENGDLTQGDWKDFVERCRSCDWTKGCGRFLNEIAEETSAVPERCLNRSVLEALKIEPQEA